VHQQHLVIMDVMQGQLHLKLEVRPGIGTVIARRPVSSRAERQRLLGREVEQLTVEAKKLGLELEDVQASVAEHWRKLERVEAREER